MEKVPLLVGGRVQMAKDIRSPGRFAEEGNVGRITTKLGDEIVNPLKEDLLITEA
jgi:hypothetical protein